MFYILLFAFVLQDQLALRETGGARMMVLPGPKKEWKD
jgi:hypothetical protein